MTGLHERAQRPEAPEQTGSPATATATPPTVSRVLALQRSAGNRAVTRALLQRDGPKTPVKPAKDDPQPRMLKEVDPAVWAEKASAIVRQYGINTTIVTLGSNASYAFDADGGSLRRIAVRVGDSRLPSSNWKLDVAHATWDEPTGLLMGNMGTPPLTDAGVKQLCEAMGYVYGGPGKFQVILLFDPGLQFTTPPPAKDEKDEKKTVTGDTPAMRQKAKKTVGDLTATWSDQPQREGSALVGTPTFKERYSERTGWHVRITLDQEVTEVPLKPGDSDKAVKDRVDAAVEKLRAKYDKAQAQYPKPAGAKSDPKAPAPPPWYVPYESHAAVKDGKALANAPPLPAVVLYKPDEANTHPTVMAGATYDFRMQVQWQFAGDLEGLSGVMNAGYYWELLAASPDDWYRLSGETPPQAPAAAAATAPPAPAPPTPAPPRTEDQAVGKGTRVTKAEDATSARKAEGRHVGEDMKNDYEAGDYTGFAGEAVAGGFRIVKTQVISAISDILDRRDPSSRRVQFPEPGFYLVRCVSSSTKADEDSKFVRSPSVAVIPVKVQLNYGVAKASAKADLEKADGKGTFARYVSELGSTRTTLEAARKLQARFAADPTLRGRLDSDPVAAAAQLTVFELAVLTLADQNKTSVEQLVKDLAAQEKEAAGDKQEEIATSWHGELKTAPDGATDYPVGGSFVVEDTGHQIPLRLMVGQAKDSTDAAPHWVVFDITSAKSRDRYEGRAMASGVPIPAEMGGHAAALREALRVFAGENPYGYGEIGLAWPESFGTVTNLKGGDLPRHLRSAPDAKKRTKSRHSAYVDIATFLIPFAKAAKLKGLVKAAETFVALAGAKNAIDALKDRARTHHLDEPGTLLELVSVIGGVKALGEGGRFVLQANELVHAARRVGSSLELLTKLENGIQIITIPLVVRDQLKAIDLMTGASAEHKAATLAFVLGRAIKTGVVSVRAIRPGEQTLFYDDAADPKKQGTPDDPARTSGGGGGGGGAGGGGGGAAGPIPPNVHRDLQQFADVYGVTVNVRRDPPNPKAPDHAEHPNGRLRAEVQWAGTPTAGPRAMNAIEREAFNKMLTAMNIGVIPSGEVTGGSAPLVRIEPTPRTGTTPSQRGTGQDMQIDEVRDRVGQTKYEGARPVAKDIPGRAGLNELEQRALDRYMARMRRTRKMTPQLEAKLRAATAEELRRQLKDAIDQQPKVDQDRAEGRHVQQTNVPDPRQARFDHERDEGGGVTTRWNGHDEQRPSDPEIEQAKDVAKATGDPVVLYGNTFAGVDGTIGNPPRTFQLKSAQDTPTLIRVIAGAKENAKGQGDRALELHVVAREISLAEATDALRATPLPFGSWLGRVVIHVRGGSFELPSSGRP